jgi:hypothetical protein
LEKLMPIEFLVSGVHTIAEYPPIALGMCMTYAMQEFADHENIHISPTLISNEQDLVELLGSSEDNTSRRHILLFSNYLWNSAENLGLSRRAKELAPSCITIHGGPDTPAYTEAARSYLTREPHVDFIVAGEGEETLKELLAALVELRPREAITLDGLRFMANGRFIETGRRPRAEDVNRFPSPYLTGFFDNADVTNWQSATIETFRGCPYGCTFCDWGSVMGSKVKMFDIDRVAAEVEWVAAKKVNTIWIADSNFGIIPRDVEIAQRICDAKERTGYPKTLILTFAKNVKSRVIDIVQLMVNAGLLGQGIISLQTTDPETLRVIKRSNIKTSEYEKLRQAFAERNLPLCVELMIALPGSNVDAVKNDLAYHFDLPIEVFIHRTVMLPNSPMADPTYQLEHEIVVDRENRVVSTSTMSSSDIQLASTICRVFQGAHRFGILRYMLRWLQWEAGLNPLSVVHDLVEDSCVSREFPLLAELLQDARCLSSAIGDLVDTVEHFREKTRNDATWGALSDEFTVWACRKYQIQQEAFIDLGRTQARLMPSAGRTFPDVVSMKHDVATWYRDWLAGEGAPLSSYGPDRLFVSDPKALSNRPLSESMAEAPSYCWELESRLSEIRLESSKSLGAPARKAMEARRTPQNLDSRQQAGQTDVPIG